MEPQVGVLPQGRQAPRLQQLAAEAQAIGDSALIRAVAFLFSGMHRQYALDFFWADTRGHKVPFNELDYPDYPAALEAFSRLSALTQVHPVPFESRDADTLGAEFLMDHIRSALAQWEQHRWGSVSFRDFCRYVLPYRVSTEPVQPWRAQYLRQFAASVDTLRNPTFFEVGNALKREARSWFTDTWGIESRKDPLPTLGAQQLLFRRQGSCADMAALMAFALRAQGIPAAVDHSVFWGTSTGSHMWAAIISDSLSVPIDMSKPDTAPYQVGREPSKVIRYTYDAQPSTLAARVPADSIPPGFLRSDGYLDVTHLYGPSADLRCPLERSPDSTSLIFSCVWNGGGWQPCFWGVQQGTSVTFRNMSRGVVYAPMLYRRGRMESAGAPVVLPLTGEPFVAKPSPWRRMRVTIPEKEKYLVYLPDKRYTLYYFDRGWVKHGEQTSGQERELTFTGVPRGALLMLRPEYSQGKERPFTVGSKGEIHYW
jgi:hypothetical protein